MSIRRTRHSRKRRCVIPRRRKCDPQTTASADERDDGDVVTGSRIKRKDNPQATKVIIQDDASRAEISRGAQQQNPKGG